MIEREDVLSVARSIDKTLTDKQIDLILEEYPSWAKQDPTATWDLIIEDLIYFAYIECP